MKKKIYIAGAGGMLGEAFYQVFKKDYNLKLTDKDVNEEWISKLDFRDKELYFDDITKFDPDFIFHLGAHTSLEYCESNIEDAYITNTLAAENATNISNYLEIPILYISTAGIFDGQKEIYDDWDMPNPLGTYARSKYMGELFVQNNNSRHLICRAGWMMGSGPKKDKKFIQKIMKQIKEGNQNLNIVNDKLGTPTYTIDFANNVKLLLENNQWGLYNMVCKGLTSRFEVTENILKILNLDKKININQVDSSFFSKEYFAPRPKSERLINKKLDLRNMNIMREWKISLKEYLNEYYSDYL